MNWKELVKLVKKHQGWMEDGEIARFPSPFNKDQFEKELAEISKKEKS